MLMVCGDMRLSLSEPAVTTPDKRNVPEHTVVVEDPAVVAELGPDEQFFTQLAVAQTRDSLEEFRTVVMPGLAHADHEFLRRLAAGIEYSFDLRSARPMTAPSLIVTGRQDAVTGYRDIWDLIELFPRATFAVLDQAVEVVLVYDLLDQHLRVLGTGEQVLSRIDHSG